MNNIILVNTLIFSNVILVYLVRELWKSNKKKDQIIRLQDNWLKEKGTSPKIKDEKFLLEKINKKNGFCKSLITGVRWNINLANIEMVQETA